MDSVILPQGFEWAGTDPRNGKGMIRHVASGMTAPYPELTQAGINFVAAFVLALDHLLRGGKREPGERRATIGLNY